jgi:hypothetical protein
LSSQIYNQAYLNEYKRRAATDLGRQINMLRWSLVQRYISRRGRVLDWGCADGTFIRSNPDSYCVEGYDINPYSGYDNHDLFYEWWDGVTLWDVIEHMFRPDAFLCALKSRHVFVATPCVIHEPTTLEGWKHYKPNEHQHYFTPSSLLSIMKRAGYKVVETNFAEGKLRDPEHEENIITMVGRRE